MIKSRILLKKTSHPINFFCEEKDGHSIRERIGIIDQHLKRVFAGYLRNGQCLACVHPIRDARGLLGEHEGSVRDARDAAESISSYLLIDFSIPLPFNKYEYNYLEN